MGFARTIFCYVLGCLPILLWFLVCKYIKDYGVLIISELVIIHILVPIIVKAFSDKIYKFNYDKYYEVSFRDAEGEIGIVVLIYIIGFLILSYVDSSKAWHYTEKIMMFPQWKSKPLIVLYAIIVGFLAIFVLPISEHYYYLGFVYINMDLRKGYRTYSLILAIFIGLKWFFLFDATVKKRSAAVFWTILFVILYAVLDYNAWNRWYYSGIAIRQIVMILYVITLILYALGVKFKRPGAVAVTRADNRLNRMC